jgi:hypothetical protein
VEPVKWKSKTHDEFSQEHYDWSEKYNHYTNGDFTRIYNPKFVKKVNEMILTKDGPYFPEVLLTSKRYNDESFFQSNCVKTYIKRTNSLLISVRRGKGDTEERASIEYEIIPFDTCNGICFDLKRVQTLGKHNNRLDDSWDDVLFKLDMKIEKMVTRRMLNTLQIEGEFGGKKVFSDFTIESRVLYQRETNNSGKNTYDFLSWKNDSIMKLNSYNYNIVPVQNWNDDDVFPL